MKGAPSIPLSPFPYQFYTPKCVCLVARSLSCSDPLVHPITLEDYEIHDGMGLELYYTSPVC